VGTVEGEFYLCPTTAGQLPTLLGQLFERPGEIPAAFRPYATQYDTYLMRFDDIVAE